MADSRTLECNKVYRIQVVSSSVQESSVLCAFKRGQQHASEFSSIQESSVTGLNYLLQSLVNLPKV